ncbi:gamma-glutamyl kinase [Rhodobacteraceae bacterium 10Alg 79]|uniref:Gamma-glutamyl kinase n=2 Tax=Rhodalgimonas zhirmunskyi TaxID=2964767 RepID=A0AAJ1U3M4_9RHOB|nr:gamma-glutamyl kinase [Rhodoalgimonas zhirmunskyi]MDQ2093106.1 gamma-glutamyl kinase [Rhodoalgimonas zhirmunskyi]
MLVFSKAKLVVLSVPKTGTTAIEEALAPHAAMSVLDPPDLKHAPVYRYNRFFRPMIEKFLGEVEIVAVMREPISWLGSWFRYRQRPFLDGRPVSTKNMDFNAFVEGYLSDPQPAYADVGSQAHFLEARPNGTSVSRIFRYEAFDEFVDFLEARLEMQIDLSRRNVSPPAPLALSPALETRLRHTNAADFELWEGLH